MNEAAQFIGKVKFNNCMGDDSLFSVLCVLVIERNYLHSYWLLIIIELALNFMQVLLKEEMVKYTVNIIAENIPPSRHWEIKMCQGGVSGGAKK